MCINSRRVSASPLPLGGGGTCVIAVSAGVTQATPTRHASKKGSLPRGGLGWKVKRDLMPGSPFLRSEGVAKQQKRTDEFHIASQIYISN